jgi:hypothetical protein
MNYYYNLLTWRVEKFWFLHLFTFVSNISMSQTEKKLFVLWYFTVWFHKTSLTPLIEVNVPSQKSECTKPGKWMYQARKVNVPSQEIECTKPGKWAIMYIAVSILHNSMIFRVDFGTVFRLSEMFCF